MGNQSIAYAEQLKRNMDKIVAIASAMPDEEIRWKPSEEVWSVLEILCHVEEGIGYWIRELVEVTRSPEREWGRTLAHPGRLQAVAQAPARNTADVLRVIEGLKEDVDAVFAEIRDEQLLIEAPHCNPKFGTRPMTFLVEHFLVEHVAQHERQIARNQQLFQNNAGQELK